MEETDDEFSPLQRVRFLEERLQENRNEFRRYKPDEDTLYDIETGRKVVGPVEVIDLTTAERIFGMREPQIVTQYLEEVSADDVLTFDADGAVRCQDEVDVLVRPPITVEDMSPQDYIDIERSVEYMQNIEDIKDDIDSLAVPAAREALVEAGFEQSEEDRNVYRVDGYIYDIELMGDEKVIGRMYRGDSPLAGGLLAAISGTEKEVHSALEREMSRVKLCEEFNDRADDFLEEAVDSYDLMRRHRASELHKLRKYVEKMQTARQIEEHTDSELPDVRPDGAEEGLDMFVHRFLMEESDLYSLAEEAGMDEREVASKVSLAKGDGYMEMEYEPEIDVTVPDQMDVDWDELGDDAVERAENLLVPLRETRERYEFLRFNYDGRPYDGVDPLIGLANMPYEDRFGGGTGEDLSVYH